MLDEIKEFFQRDHLIVPICMLLARTVSHGHSSISLGRIMSCGHLHISWARTVSHAPL